MEHAETINQRADRLVRQEVFLCVSSVVAALAGSYGSVHRLDSFAGLHPKCDAANSLADLTEQAAELAAPVLDYEEAAREAGWVVGDSGLQFINESRLLPPEYLACGSFDAGFVKGQAAEEHWRKLCEAHDIEPHEREVFEFWAVSSWLAEKLDAKGEKVDRDFASWNVWARTTSGQAISIDSVIEEIVRDLSKAEG